MLGWWLPFRSSLGCRPARPDGQPTRCETTAVCDPNTASDVQGVCANRRMSFNERKKEGFRTTCTCTAHQRKLAGSNSNAHSRKPAKKNHPFHRRSPRTHRRRYGGEGGGVLAKDRVEVRAPPFGDCPGSKSCNSAVDDHVRQRNCNGSLDCTQMHAGLPLRLHVVLVLLTRSPCVSCRPSYQALAEQCKL